MKFILTEQKKFVLEEKYILLEKINATKYPNIIKLYPEAEKANNIWAALDLKNVDTFNDDMLKLLDSYFAADWITKEQCDELIKTAGSNYKGLNYSGVKTLFNKFKKEHEEKLISATDWADVYKQCGECKNKQKAYNAFWFGGLPLKNESNLNNELPVAANDKVKQGYYRGEWGNQGELIRSFGSHFTNLLSEYGWTETLNPFISFLKHIFKAKIITINDATFAHLLEAFNNNLISKKDLRCAGALEEYNLIFNPNLYKDSSNFIAYLKGQDTVIRKANELPVGGDLKIAFANIAAKDGNSKDLKDNKIIGIIKDNSFTYEIRPLTAYRELIKLIFDPNDEEKETSKDATDIQINTIVKSITTPDTAKKFLAYLISVCRIMNTSLANELNNKFDNKLIQNRNNTITTFEEEIKFDKILNRSTTKYSAKQLEAIITEVIKIAKI